MLKLVVLALFFTTAFSGVAKRQAEDGADGEEASGDGLIDTVDKIVDAEVQVWTAAYTGRG